MGFTNREITTIFWLLCIVIFCLRNADVRKSAYDVIRAFSQWKIFSIFLATYLYLGIGVYLLGKVGVWKYENLKTTIVWVSCYTFQSLVNINLILRDDKYFVRSVRNIFAISGIVSFIFGLHSFDLIVEVLIVPLISFFVLYQAISKRKNSIISFMLIFIVALYLLYTIYINYVDFDKLASVSTLREFFIPIILAIISLPFLWLLAVVSEYDAVFSVLKHSIKSEPLLKNTKLKALLEFKFKTKELRRWSQSVVRFRLQDEKKLAITFSEARMIAAHEAKPPVITRELGWSPSVVSSFLLNEGIKLGDYVKNDKNEWSACSNYLNLDDGILSNNISLYVCGNDIAVTEIKIILNIYNIALSSSAENKFISMSYLLYLKAINKNNDNNLFMQLKKCKNFRIAMQYWTVALKRTNWGHGVKDSYSLDFSIISKSNKVF